MSAPHPAALSSPSARAELLDPEQGGAGLDHPLLDDFLRLTDAALRRGARGAVGAAGAEGARFVAESLAVLERALERGCAPHAVLTPPRWLPRLDELAARHPALSGAAILTAGEGLLEEITGYALHRGTLASFTRPPAITLSEALRGRRAVVVLEDIVDHANLGALFRTAAALGAEAIVVSPRCADPLCRRSLRVSMGAALQVPWARAESWPALRAALTAEGLTLVALALRDDAVSLRDLAPPPRAAVLLGAEGRGLSAEALAHADVVARVPMAAGVDSLNVAAAGAVAMWALLGAPAP